MIVEGGNNVSGGQKQRLCIARALLKKPKILILDDSTSAVDTKTDALIRQAFREEIPDTTKIIIAQRISSSRMRTSSSSWRTVRSMESVHRKNFSGQMLFTEKYMNHR